MMDKVVLAYSGGLDTSVAIKWIKDKYGLDVIAVTVDVGNEKDFGTVREKALKVGAIKALVIDAKKDFVNDYIFPTLKAGSLYESVYPMATSLARPLIAKLLTEVALKEGAAAIAHGCTGKGNDQVRFEVAINTLAPHIKIIAPAREWGMTREDTIKYASKNGISVPVKSGHAYSVDENLWGRSVECGVLEDPWAEPPEEVYAWTKSPTTSPAKPDYSEIEFDKGIPVACDGEKMDGVALITKLNELAGKHGVGRIDHVENRLVGIKSREIYEAPAAILLLAAHQALEDLTLAKDQSRFKARVAAEFADLIYNGLWFTANRLDMSAYVDSTQRFVTGTVRVKLFKGACTVVGRKSSYSLYSHGLATYEKGDQFDQSAAPGFIHIFGLPVKTQAKLQPLFDMGPKNKTKGKGK
ncbi:MAG: argininosuccinate synthase [Dehalococcoidia bacterium]|nr:MAG: argininosuccinate synthase [Dehalococcoidia bacterium]